MEEFITVNLKTKDGVEQIQVSQTVPETKPHEKEKKEPKYVTENEFLQQMMAESHRCTEAIEKANASILWNLINTILLIVVILLSV